MTGDEQSGDRLRIIEERLGRIERHLGLAAPPTTAEAVEPPSKAVPRAGEEFEYEVGQNWFAKAGIVVLALGMVFLLTIPHAGLPPALPGLVGFALAGSLFLAARILRSSFDLVSRYLRGAGMVLLFFTTLRLFYFSPTPPLEASSPAGILLLVAVVLLNVVVALRRNSPWLFGIAITTGYAAGVAAGPAWFLHSAVAATALLTAVTTVRTGWMPVLAFSTLLAYLAHFTWTIGNPFLGNPPAFVAGTFPAPVLPLVYAAIFAAAVLGRRDRAGEGSGVIVSSFLNGIGGYGIFLLHTAVALPGSMVAAHLSASAVFLVLAVLFWTIERSRFSTFAYAMLGYLALSVAILVASAVPELFVWLSVQSLVVAATAVWFRSRFIVVANFGIYVAVAVGYVVAGGEETGISIWFGVVALATARILKWKQDRLELKTEMMRNAYLASGFAIFPYATWHLVPAEYVSLSWVGIAGLYYLMNLIVRSPKYRWMGHLTLLVTVIYVLVVGIARLTPTYRIVSFLVLGTVLLAGSLIFTRLRSKRRAREAAARGDAPAGP